MVQKQVACLQLKYLQYDHFNYFELQSWNSTIISTVHYMYKHIILQHVYKYIICMLYIWNLFHGIHGWNTHMVIEKCVKYKSLLHIFIPSKSVHNLLTNRLHTTALLKLHPHDTTGATTFRWSHILIRYNLAN